MLKAGSVYSTGATAAGMSLSTQTEAAGGAETRSVNVAYHPRIHA
ncbi:hypothetical protein [Herminiimonas arsenitoxidans]|nr:hypothetical protein [Herminiimonas arsenitoxidans]